MAKSVKEEIPAKEEIKVPVTDAVVTETVETTTSDVDDEEEVAEVKVVAVKTATVKEAAVKKIRIHITEAVDSYIGGVSHKYAKDKDVEVPADVAAILVNGKKAYRN